jgi:hypothetical protein
MCICVGRGDATPSTPHFTPLSQAEVDEGVTFLKKTLFFGDLDAFTAAGAALSFTIRRY